MRCLLVEEKIQFNTYPTKEELEMIKAAAKEAKQSTSDFMVMASLIRIKMIEEGKIRS